MQYTGAVQLPDLGWSLQCEMCKCAQCRQCAICAICADKALSLCPIVEPGLCSVHVVQCAIVVQCAPICHNMQQSCHVVQVQSSDLLIAGQRARPTSHPNASPHSHDGSSHAPQMLKEILKHLMGLRAFGTDFYAGRIMLAVVSSVRSSSGYHGLIEISSSNPLFQIFQILQILK